LREESRGGRRKRKKKFHWRKKGGGRISFLLSYHFVNERERKGKKGRRKGESEEINKQQT